MIQEAEIKVRRQLAHIFATYGDQPDELIHKLELLVIEWFIKGEQNNNTRN